MSEDLKWEKQCVAAVKQASHQSNTVLCPEFVICGNSLLKVYDLVATSANCM